MTHELVLQPDQPAVDLIADALVGAVRLDVASAFVTRSGVELLSSLPLPLPRRFRLVCRAGHGPTEPDAIALAADELNADIRLVCGPAAPRFHPKLYLVAHRDRLVVVAGSGNFTAGGLRDNVEQFEHLELPGSSPQALSQQKRFNAMWDQGAPLGEVRSSAFWDAWVEQQERVARLRTQREGLDLELDRLAESLAPTATAVTDGTGGLAVSSARGARWRHEDLFPIIARIIRELAAGTSGFVSRPRIQEALMRDEEAAPFIVNPAGSVNLHKVGNMVDWFSKEFPGSEWDGPFERRRQRAEGLTGGVSEVWAYRPKR